MQAIVCVHACVSICVVCVDRDMRLRLFLAKRKKSFGPQPAGLRPVRSLQVCFFFFFVHFSFFLIFALSWFSGVYSNGSKHENQSFKSSVGLIHFARCYEKYFTLHLLKRSLHCICPCFPPFLFPFLVCLFCIPVCLAATIMLPFLSLSLWQRVHISLQQMNNRQSHVWYTQWLLLYLAINLKRESETKNLF